MNKRLKMDYHSPFYFEYIKFYFIEKFFLGVGVSLYEDFAEFFNSFKCAL